MAKRLTPLIVCLAITAQVAWCDWHHGGGGSDAPADPVVNAFIWTVLLAAAASAALLLCGGPLLIIFTRRIRHTLWVIPAANLPLYLLSISLRPYPGGFAARFRPPGLVYTIIEIVLLLVMSFLVALIVALVQWIVRKVRPLVKKDAAGP